MRTGPDYLRGIGTGETPLATATADLLFAVTRVLSPIAPTSMPRARATAPSLRDMEVPPRTGITNGDTLSLIGTVSSRAHFDPVQNRQQSDYPAFAKISPGERVDLLLPR